MISKLLSFINNPLGLSIIALLLISVLTLAWRWQPGRRFVRQTFCLLPALVLWLVGIVAMAFWKPASFVTHFVLRYIPLDKLASAILDLPAKITKDPLLQGDREKTARLTWPAHIFPDLYRPVPLDIIRPPYEDGILIGGVPLTHLADRHLTDSAYRSSIHAGFAAGLLFFLLVGVLLVLKTLGDVIGFVPDLLGGQQPILEQWPGADPIRVSVWSAIAVNAISAFGHLFANLARLLVYLPAAALIALGTAILVSLLLLGSWMRQQAAPYEFVTKDAAVRWPYRIETRRILQETYRRQVEHATTHLAGASTFKIGTATGTLRARGDLAGPTSGQAIKLDEESLFQHMLVFGGTGEGKTTAVLKPLMRTVLADKRYGAFVVDAKGVLWRDAQKVARELGREKDVVVIGLDSSNYGVNVTAGLTPSQIAGVLRSVLTQIGGDRRDAFWPNMASTILRHMLTIGAGYALTPNGQKEPAPHPTSLWWAYQAVLNPQLVTDAVASIRAECELLEIKLAEIRAQPNVREQDTALVWEAFQKLTATDLTSSVEYIETAWADMAKSTRTGIIANVTNLLDGFGSAPEMRERFVSGSDIGTIAADAALNGKIVLVNLSAIEDGLPARLIMILLKTALYRAARRREIAFRREGRSVSENPCLVVMDEVQELATVDPASGLSDATFWNVARSTGLAGLFATQTVSALVQAMGKEAADNFIQQARSKVFFRTEEQETVNFACWCAGEYERNRVYESGQRESIEYRELIDNWTPFAPVREGAEIQPGPRAFFAAAGALLNPERTQLRSAVARRTYEPDLRFVPSSEYKDGKDVNHVAIQSAVGAAFWRAEDLDRAYRSNGNELRPALTSSDLMHMGRWHAFAQIQRAGAVRQDIVTVEHDFS